MVKQIKSTFTCKKSKVNLGSIPICTYDKSMDDEIAAGLTKKAALDLLEEMHSIRAIEDMLEQIKLGLYKNRFQTLAMSALPTFHWVRRPQQPEQYRL